MVRAGLICQQFPDSSCVTMCKADRDEVLLIRFRDNVVVKEKKKKRSNVSFNFEDTPLSAFQSSLGSYLQIFKMTVIDTVGGTAAA